MSTRQKYVFCTSSVSNMSDLHPLLHKGRIFIDDYVHSIKHSTASDPVTLQIGGHQCSKNSAVIIGESN